MGASAAMSAKVEGGVVSNEDLVLEGGRDDEVAIFDVDVCVVGSCLFECTYAG